MIKILITGKNSYLGMNFKNAFKNNVDKYQIDELDMLDKSWKDYDFSSYDVVYHVAGLAHSTPNESQKELYYQVNTDLAYETARKAKESGVKQFIFMSSIIVYGNGKINKNYVINKNTPLNPENFYGDTKKQAELKIQSLANPTFKVAIIRPPMIYGPKSRGNYPMLAEFARKTLLFPTMQNQRSMLFVGNLIEFLKLIIDNEDSGIFFPQNKEYVSSVELVKEIASLHHHKIVFTCLFNPILKLFCNEKHVNKVFGNLVIDKRLSEYPIDYCKYSFKESIRLSEEIDKKN